MTWVPPAGSPRDRGMEGGLLAVRISDGVPTVVAIFGAFPQCAWLWSPTAFAGLLGSQEGFCCGQSLLGIVAVESCKDSDLSAV
jgi:hypothetical protein